jgi:hypothetical protein
MLVSEGWGTSRDVPLKTHENLGESEFTRCFSSSSITLSRKTRSRNRILFNTKNTQKKLSPGESNPALSRDRGRCYRYTRRDNSVVIRIKITFYKPHFRSLTEKSPVESLSPPRNVPVNLCWRTKCLINLKVEGCLYSDGNRPYLPHPMFSHSDRSIVRPRSDWRRNPRTPSSPSFPF